MKPSDAVPHFAIMHFEGIFQEFEICRVKAVGGIRLPVRISHFSVTYVI